MSILIETRYRGLRAPHKIKSRSRAARASARGPEQGLRIIATKRAGTSTYVATRMKRRRPLFAVDVDDDMLIKLIDRFLMFYIRTRSSAAHGQLASINSRRSRLISSRWWSMTAWGICAELEQEMQHLVELSLRMEGGRG